MIRKPQVAIIGSNTSAASESMTDFAEELGIRLIDAGYRIICGGCGGVMEGACKGAQQSKNYQEGCIVGILPSLDGTEGNEYLDIEIRTGLSFARNQVIVASADIVVAIGGGAGTLSEIAFAWQLGKKIICVDSGEGWSSRLAGSKLDDRQKDSIYRSKTVEETLTLLKRLLEIQNPPESRKNNGVTN